MTNRLVRRDIEEDLLALFAQPLPFPVEKVERRKPTWHQRLHARVWAVRFRVANLIYPYPGEDE